jgi:hypothetical protein
MGSPRAYRFIFFALSLGMIFSCQQNASNNEASTRVGPTTNNTKGTSSFQVAFTSTNPLIIYTSEAKTNNCTTFSIKASDTEGKAVAGVKLEFSLAGVADAEKALWGTLPVALTTAADGQVSGSFCAASKIGTAIIVASYKDASDKVATANSSPIEITVKPLYTLTYNGSNLTSLGAKVSDPISMNLFESGPNDCGNLEFILQKSDEPLADVQLKFQSDFGYPSGTKLRTRSSSEQSFETDPQTQRKFLSYNATSDANGIFSIPICAGSLPGSLVVFANYTDAFGKKIYVKSPSITIGSGFASLLNLGLGFNTTNARTLKALFNNETPTPQEFTAQINSKLGGRLSVLDPVSVHLESGGITFDNNNGGVPDANGSVKFSVLASHNGSYRPTPVYYFNDALAQSTCNPFGIANSLPNADSVFSFTDLSKNWRSTMVYMTRGQEPFSDANDNKKYDIGGDGFWDKDQDGTYTKGIDTVTFFGDLPATPACRCKETNAAPPEALATLCTEVEAQPSCFKPNSEWFIDLPTPFVDADENGKYEATVNGSDMDRLIDDSYQNPNGARDNDTSIWKSTTLPVYTGTSIYSMLRAGIAKNTSLGDPIPSEYNPALAYLRKYNASLWPDNIDRHAGSDYALSANLDRMHTWRYVHAQGICGTPVPGGSDITVNVIPHEAVASDRAVTAHIFIQPADEIMDSSRRLLSESGGSNSAKVNFNISEHEAAAASFPVQYRLTVSPCNRVPAGGAGKWCSPSRFEITTKVDNTFVTGWLTVPEVNASTCLSPTWKKNNTNYSCESCPKLKPKLNPTTNICETCPFSTPRYETEDNTCNACPASEPKFESSSNTCVACSSDKPRFDSATNSCNACPSSTPKYDGATNTCNACPGAAPKYESSSNSCSACATGTTYNAEANSCVPNQAN